jgi:REP element-mobilizing transposase RayT
MANTYTSLLYHLVFSTKRREPWIGRQAEPRLWSYLGGIARENKIKPILVGGRPDHVHMAVSIPAALPVSKAVQFIKGGSSAWIKDALPGMKGFAWQDGYGAFTVSRSNLDEVVKYIGNQKEHHRQKSFQEEFLTFLKRHDVDYDERYLWD